MARPIWNGVIAFGMVSIPVGASPATGDKDLAFNQIHSKCHSRIKLQKHCPNCNTVVAAEEIVKGYEFAKGQYVIMDPADFEDLPIISAKKIEIVAFVDAGQIDPVYFDKTYYLEPSEVGRKPFALLFQALTSKNSTAVGKVALRNKEVMCLLRPTKYGVVLETLFWPDELRAHPAYQPSAEDVNPVELKMAEGLIDLLYGEFEPGNFTDEYRAELLRRIDIKKSGGQIVAPAAAAPSDERVFNLMDALKASLEAAKNQSNTG